MVETVLGPAVHLGGQGQAGTHGLSAPGHGKKDTGAGIAGETKGQVKALPEQMISNG